jgi:magnesium chelatase accessory protein
MSGATIVASDLDTGAGPSGLPADWPNRQYSRCVRASGIRWHVQCAGHGPVMLMLHGTGASSHSWRDLISPLARHYRVIAPDLPGHGFSTPIEAGRYSLPGVTRALNGLLAALDASPSFVVGHSAGAAIALEMALPGRGAGASPRGVVAINGAVLPFAGVAGYAFPPVARLASASRLLAHALARRARDRAAVERLITSTGSRLSPAGIDWYGRLLQDPAHIRAVFSMMAGWDLRPLLAALPKIDARVTLIVGENDKTIAPAQADDVAARLPHATVVRLPGLGHLAHEEAPDHVVREIVRACGIDNGDNG